MDKMKTIVHPLNELSNLPLTSETFGRIINLGKNVAVIYSFKKGEDKYIGRTINLQARMKEHKISPFIKHKRKNCTILYNSVNKYG